MPELPQQKLSEQLQQLLLGKTVKAVRASDRELLIELDDGGRLFVDSRKDGGLELSVT